MSCVLPETCCAITEIPLPEYDIAHTDTEKLEWVRKTGSKLASIKINIRIIKYRNVMAYLITTSIIIGE
jgi:hypothetical protein